MSECHWCDEGRPFMRGGLGQHEPLYSGGEHSAAPCYAKTPPELDGGEHGAPNPSAYYDLSERELCSKLGYCPDCRELAHDGECFKR